MSQLKIAKKANEDLMRKVSFGLVIAAVVLFIINYAFLKNQKYTPDESWRLAIEFSHVTRNDNQVFTIQPPYESKNVRIVKRSISHAGLRIISTPRNALSKREIRLRGNKTGTYSVDVEFILQFGYTPYLHALNESILNTKKRHFYLADNELYHLDSPIIESTLFSLGINQTEPLQLIDNIFKFVNNFSNYDSLKDNSAPEILKRKSGSHKDKAILMVALARKANIPARLVRGIELVDDPLASTVFWVEVYVDDVWLSYHPGKGYAQTLPDNYVAMDKSGEGIVTSLTRVNDVVEKELIKNVEILIERMPDSIINPNKSNHEWYQIFMLERLSAETRQQLSLLMLLPLGALLCSLIRQIAGLHSYGVFTPTILALAITYADSETTLMLLLIVLLLIYFGRPTFNHGMSRTPRLSIIFTLVAVSMVLGVSLLDYLSFTIEGHLILLPIVIITSLIDRFFSAIEIHGHRTALIRLIWTFILTMAILPVLQMDWLGALILRYPEIHLITLSMLILISYFPFGKYKLPGWLGILAEQDSKKGRNSKNI